MIRESAFPPLAVADGPATDDLTVRRVETLAEYLECVAIQEETWGVGFRELVPPAILMASQTLGGVCAAAFTPDGRMLGFVFGMTGLKDGALAHWSDLLAVRAEARGMGLGERLKRHQRDLVRAVGIATMFWTFDPLFARNAHLNLVRLGARAARYVPNMYGDNTGSPLHGGVATDRFVAEWDLRDSADGARPAHVPHVAHVTHDAAPLVNPTTPDGLPVLAGLPDAPAVRIAIPRDVESLSIAERGTWRAVTREAFLAYFARGYTVTSFDRGDDGAPPSYEMRPPA